MTAREGLQDEHRAAAVPAHERWRRDREVAPVGGFAAERLHRLFADSGAVIGQVLHPSPASPAANRDWEDITRVPGPDGPLG